MTPVKELKQLREIEAKARKLCGWCCSKEERFMCEECKVIDKVISLYRRELKKLESKREEKTIRRVFGLLRESLKSADTGWFFATTISLKNMVKALGLIEDEILSTLKSKEKGKEPSKKEAAEYVKRNFGDVIKKLGEE